MLGEGEFGEVENKEGVAVKYYKGSSNRIKITPDIIREINALTMLKDQRGFVQLIDYHLSTNSTCFISMTLYDNNLKEYMLRTELQVRQNNANDVLSQLNSALLILEDKMLEHSDIKPSNILTKVTSNGLEVVLCDFGCCVCRRVNTYYYGNDSNDVGYVVVYYLQDISEEYFDWKQKIYTRNGRKKILFSDFTLELPSLINVNIELLRELIDKEYSLPILETYTSNWTNNIKVEFSGATFSNALKMYNYIIDNNHVEPDIYLQLVVYICLTVLWKVEILCMY